MREFTLTEKTQMSAAFDRGNYANAYETTDLETALAAFNGGDADEGTIGFNRPGHERAAFVLGFFSTYELSEMCGSDREIFDDAYWSDAGQYVVKVARYCDERDDDFASECDTVG